jgi:hypothetical protein
MRKKLSAGRKCLAKARELLDYGTDDDVRAAAKVANPDITEAELEVALKRFRDAVSERERRDR